VSIKLLCMSYSFISIHNVQNLLDMMNSINKFHKNLPYTMFKPSWRKHIKLCWSQTLTLMLAGWEWLTTSAWWGVHRIVISEKGSIQHLTIFLSYLVVIVKNISISYLLPIYLIFRLTAQFLDNWRNYSITMIQVCKHFRIHLLDGSTWKMLQMPIF